ncbi:sensor histidine kinase [Ancylobacter amanitiformis]|uniref:histidine kinase n=1 Tax=Ancylobacter amanitiformis TaxID=217069 RepID=A0ABU0LU48_9HYPH|nr:ATP-binding protein [Ancylobacter amanitiformis]MDQ0512208.1 PAS domain S-box-containing protein [Ancylobacter amanitiformis]
MDRSQPPTRRDARSVATTRNWQMAVLVTVLAALIFAIDTLSPLDMAIAVLYVVVVLLSAPYFERKGVLAVGGLCIALAMMSFMWMHAHDLDPSAIMRCLVSIAAISVTTLLSLRNEEATRSLREQADLLDLTHDAIFVRDATDTILYWSKGAEELYGWSRSDAVGQKTAQLLRTVFPSPPADIRAELLRAGRWEGELIHCRKDGSEVVVMSRWSLQRDERGRPALTMETNSDISERRKAEDALHKAESELAHVTRVTTMGELTASIAHEINQPLAAVVTNGEACLRWLGRPIPDIGEARATVERMISNGRRASQVVARLRSLARRSDPEHRPVDVNEVVDDVLLLLERELSTHRVALELTLDRSLPTILGDRVQLQQVMLNLALNAIQSMDAVAPKRRRLGFVTRRSGAGEDDGVIMEVKDSGPGIEADNLPLLFNAFYTTKKEGMGMGLSISRSIIEAHSGRIMPTLREGGGMLFTVKLPITKENQP